MTSSLIVLAFDTMDEAEQVHQALVRGKKEGMLTIEDAAVVVKDAEGAVRNLAWLQPAGFAVRSLGCQLTLNTPNSFGTHPTQNWVSDRPAGQ